MECTVEYPREKTGTQMTSILHPVRDLHFASYHAAGSK
jgi:hypothetical protein